MTAAFQLAWTTGSQEMPGMGGSNQGHDKQALQHAPLHVASKHGLFRNCIMCCVRQREIGGEQVLGKVR